MPLRLTPAERRGKDGLVPQFQVSGGPSITSPSVLAGTYPWVQRAPHSTACDNMASLCARHEHRKVSRPAPHRHTPQRLTWVSWLGVMDLRCRSSTPEWPLCWGREGMSIPGWSLLPVPTHPKGKEPTNNSGFFVLLFYIWGHTWWCSRGSSSLCTQELANSGFSPMPGKPLYSPSYLGPTPDLVVLRVGCGGLAASVETGGWSRGHGRPSKGCVPLLGLTSACPPGHRTL